MLVNRAQNATPEKTSYLLVYAIRCKCHSRYLCQPAPLYSTASGLRGLTGLFDSGRLARARYLTAATARRLILYCLRTGVFLARFWLSRMPLCAPACMVGYLLLAVSLEQYRDGSMLRF